MTRDTAEIHTFIFSKGRHRPSGVQPKFSELPTCHEEEEEEEGLGQYLTGKKRRLRKKDVSFTQSTGPTTSFSMR